MKITKLPPVDVGTSKVLRTGDGAALLKMDEDKFLRVAKQLGLTPKQGKRQFLWSEADVEAVRRHLAG